MGKCQPLNTLNLENVTIGLYYYNIVYYGHSIQFHESPKTEEVWKDFRSDNSAKILTPFNIRIPFYTVLCNTAVNKNQLERNLPRLMFMKVLRLTMVAHHTSVTHNPSTKISLSKVLFLFKTIHIFCHTYPTS